VVLLCWVLVSGWSAVLGKYAWGRGICLELVVDLGMTITDTAIFRKRDLSYRRRENFIETQKGSPTQRCQHLK
jgi:hypothetical protein